MISRLTCSLLLVVSGALAAQEPDQAALDHFERKVRPLLSEHCVSCHGAKKQESSLRLDRRVSAFAEFDFGTAVIPGKPADSRLLQVVRYKDDDIQMPPKGKLREAEILLLEEWIKSGAAWPEDKSVDRDAEAWKNHWAFQPIDRPEPPEVTSDAWSITGIDRFILAQLRNADAKPQEPAGARTLARRAYFDLVGLPPTFNDVQSLQAATDDSAYMAMIDRLLDSEHFGERWARHWMDVARYSDTTGYVFTQDRKLGDAWKYREWLIEAFNDDMPIDEFLIHQIAADKVLPVDAGDKLAATGFLTLGRRFLNNSHDIIDDRIDVMTRGMMGLTVTCARCHDHKYDPIPAADYYSLYGVFASTHEPDRKKSTVRLADLPKPFNPYVFKRGQAHNRGKQVPRQFLSALTTKRQPFVNGSGRLELARAIANKDNPLTARVFVNRVWGHMFGSHLVATPSDFGLRSDPPTHPQLLDYLASSFIDNGWSLKKLIREIAASSVYRQASIGSLPVSDPENRLLSRMNRKRLDFEAHRDALLAVSGELDRTVGGESVDITKTPFPRRRAVYSYIDRQNLPGLFRAFDLASPDTHTPQRHETTVPQQGLYQLNNPFILERSIALAARTESVKDPEHRISALFRAAYARDPNANEVSDSLLFIQSPQREGSRREHTEPGWHYGFGRFDSTQNQVVAFTPYPYFGNETWSGGQALPDQRLGWSLLNSTGGHPGSTSYAAIRRWIAPASGQLTISGTLRHPAEEGDGVIGRIVSSRAGQIGEWRVAHGEKTTELSELVVESGDVIDLVCESGETINHDSFRWSVEIQLKSDGSALRFDSRKQFSGTVPEPLNAWARYAQVLLLANEFVFVD